MSEIIDTLALFNRFEKALFSKEQAEELSTAIADVVDAQLATKRDLLEVEAGLKRDMKEFEVSLKRDLKETEIGLKRDIKELELSLKHDLTLRMYGLTGLVIGSVGLMIKFL